MRPADRNITLAALRDWARQHRRYPTQPEWDRTAPGRPSARTIDRRWGWQRMLAEGGGLGPDHARTLKTEHRRQKMLMALGAAYIELGRWPTGREWEHATTAHAARRTYVREFGSWADACQAAERARQLSLASQRHGVVRSSPIVSVVCRRQKNDAIQPRGDMDKRGAEADRRQSAGRRTSSY